MSRLTSTFFVILLATTVVAWLATLATTLSLHQSDHAGNGLSYSYATVGVGITWVLLAVVLFMSVGRVPAPTWVPIVAVLAFVVSAVAAITVVNLLNDSAQFPAQWPIVTLVFAPFLMLAFASWNVFPSVQRLVEPNAMFVGVWSTVIALSVLPFPLRMIQKRELAEQRESYMRAQAAGANDENTALQNRFESLSDSSHLREFLALTSTTTEMRVAVLARIQTLPNRQKDAVEMLSAGEGVAMGELRNLSLDATPALCASVTSFLQKHATDYRGKVSRDNNRFIVAAQELDKYVFGLQWMAEHQCDVRSAILAYKDTALAYPESPERAQYISRLTEISERLEKSLGTK